MTSSLNRGEEDDTISSLTKPVISRQKYFIFRNIHNDPTGDVVTGRDLKAANSYNPFSASINFLLLD